MAGKVDNMVRKILIERVVGRQKEKREERSVGRVVFMDESGG